MPVDIPFELIQQMERGDCVLFVGAGLSRDAGLPGWRQLLEPLRDQLGCSADADPLTVAQVFEFRYDRRLLLEHIRDQTDSAGKELPRNLSKLAEMPFKTWVTTNYDNLIEKALNACGKRYNSVVRDMDLAFVRSDQTTLIKLHGDREQPDSIIITRSDYDTGLWRSPGLKDEISQLLRKNTFLFIGYGVMDPDFNQIHSQIRFDFGWYSRKIYAVLFDVDAFAHDDLCSRGIEVINLSSAEGGHSECLFRFIMQLRGERHLTANLPKNEHYFPEANEKEPQLIKALNERGIAKSFEKRGRRLVKCEEYLIHSILTEQGQPNALHPKLAPSIRQRLNLPNQSVEEYERTDEDGNI